MRASELYIVFSNNLFNQWICLCSIYRVSLMQVIAGFQPCVQASTSAEDNIKVRFSVADFFGMNDSVSSSVLDSYFWRGICYVIFLFRGPKYIFIIIYFHLQINQW